MNQIYHFDCESPPALSETTLIDELERRKTIRQAVLLALSGILFNICLAIAAYVLYPINERLSLTCIAYILITMCGSIAMAAVYATKKREEPACQHLQR